MTQLNQVPGPYEDTTCQMVVAYGNPHHSHLETIRKFRDDVLKSLPFGDNVIQTYYNLTPKIAALARRNSLMRKITLLSSAYPAYLVSLLSLKAYSISKNF